MAFLTEADTCRRYVLPKLYAADWIDEQISEQKSFTDGRIVVAGTKVKRRPQKRADYLLRYRRDFPIAVVEAKTIYAKRGDGLQQAKEYAQILGLKFAYATNGHGIVEHDFITGQDNDLDGFPTAEDLWGAFAQAKVLTRRPQSGSSRRVITCRASCRDTTRKSRSTGRCRRFCRASAAYS